MWLFGTRIKIKAHSLLPLTLSKVNSKYVFILTVKFWLYIPSIALVNCTCPRVQNPRVIHHQAHVPQQQQLEHLGMQWD